MRNKKGFKKFFPLIVPVLALVALLIIMLVIYHNALVRAESWTTEYFLMLTESCSHETERMRLELVAENEHAGNLIAYSGLQSDVMAQNFESVFSESEAETGIVVTSSGTLVFGTNAIYNIFSETINKAFQSEETVFSDVEFCPDGEYRFAVATPVTMSYGGSVTVTLVYPMSILASLTDVPKLDSTCDIYLLRSDGFFLTGRDSVGSWSDVNSHCSLPQLSDTKGELAEFKNYSKDGKYIAFAEEIGFNNWYSYCVAPLDIVRQRTTQNVSVFFRITVIAIIILGGTFLYYYFIINYGNRRQALDRKKFAIAARQSARAVFEYDMMKDKFYFINDCEKINMPGGVNYLTRSMGMNYVYPQDRGNIKDMVMSLKDSCTAAATVRVSCFCCDNIYHWYYITVTRLARKGLGSTYIIGIIEDIDEREKERIALLTKATTDGLTGLYNRDETVRLINERLQQPHDQKVSAFIIFDLDDFKGINDNYGHDMGDMVLQFFSDMLKATFRSDDIVGRLGGDEFVVFMSYTSDDDFVKRRFSAFTESITTRRYEDDEMPYISCSAGYVTAREGDDFYKLYRRADKALYRAKTIGKNCVVCGD